MRIVHVSDCFAPRTGGIETQVRDLGVAQAATGDEVIVVTATPDRRAPAAAGAPVPRVVRIAMDLPGELPIHPRARSRIRDHLAFERPDVVHVHVGVVSPFAWSGIAAARDLALPTVVTIHGVWGPLARRAFRRVRRWADGGAVLTAVSEVAAASVRGVGPGLDVAVIPNGIDTGTWSQLPWRPMTDRLRVVSVLRLAPRKRAGALVDALVSARSLVPAGIVLSADLIGDGPEAARLRRRIDRAGMADSIRLLGRLDRKGIREAFGRSDVFVQASVRESFGLAALEARASGLPVIARRESGTSSFIRDGVDGLLVDDDRELAMAVAGLAADRPLLDRLAAGARVEPVAQSWPRVVGDFEAAYRRAARGPGQ